MGLARIKLVAGVVVFILALQPAPSVADEFYLGGHGGKILLRGSAEDHLNEDQFSGGLVFGTDLTAFRQTVLDKDIGCVRGLIGFRL